jgi:putative mRNA 3-end processing factor
MATTPADWNGLLDVIRCSGAERVWVTHGYTGPMVRWLHEQGLEVRAVETRFEGELEEVAAEEPAVP